MGPQLATTAIKNTLEKEQNSGLVLDGELQNRLATATNTQWINDGLATVTLASCNDNSWGLASASDAQVKDHQCRLATAQNTWQGGNNWNLPRLVPAAIAFQRKFTVRLASAINAQWRNQTSGLVSATNMHQEFNLRMPIATTTTPSIDTYSSWGKVM